MIHGNAANSPEQTKKWAVIQMRSIAPSLRYVAASASVFGTGPVSVGGGGEPGGVFAGFLVGAFLRATTSAFVLFCSIFIVNGFNRVFGRTPLPAHLGHVSILRPSHCGHTTSSRSRSGPTKTTPSPKQYRHLTLPLPSQTTHRFPGRS